MEPNPSRPSSGSGEAVWGSFWPFWSPAGALSAAVAVLSVEVAVWSAAVALLAGAAFGSVPAVVLAGAVVVLGAAAL